ncbi:hypothetical protein GOC23_06325 [Sinorhizobium meliloti]|uniref:hypothetical protein n=1 Tax=Rhizobium meliloti TaxID=382 RepID=UPI0018E8BCE1|nr:hypothetical protein [Sinorhizobium meliloti]MDX0367283.1 hypothetical protein [Sinorhizobium meliloti]QQF06659.1 hypothetical protein JFX10_31785 [Sinorhizobium meliloti]
MARATSKKPLARIEPCVAMLVDYPIHFGGPFHTITCVVAILIERERTEQPTFSLLIETAR